MTTRFVFRFNWGEVAGWSEEYFLNYVFGEGTRLSVGDVARDLSVSRASMMSKNCIIEDARINDVETPESVIPYDLGVQGTRGVIAGDGTDNGPEPVMACIRNKAAAPGAKTRVMHFRGLADADVRDGRVASATVINARRSAFLEKLQTYLASTQVSGFLNTWDLASIAGSTRLLTLTGVTEAVLVKEDAIAIQAHVVGSGPRVNARAVVESVVSPTTYRLTSWSHGDTTYGTVRTINPTYSQWGSIARYYPDYVTFKKTGRPFTPFRGRASARS